MLQWASIAPLGLPGGARGVEDHGGVFFADLDRRRQRRAVGEFGKARESLDHHRPRSGASHRECRPRRARGRPARPRGSAAARRNRSAHRRSRAFAGGSKAAPSPARHAPRPASSARIRCGCRAAPRRGRRAAGRVFASPPRSAPIAARLRAMSFACRRRPAPRRRRFRATASATIAGMLFGPFAKGRNDAIAEARLEPHRRNGVLRPVHGAPRQLFFIS